MNFETPKVMGILNLTPDSFFDGGKYAQKDTVKKRIETLVSEGADIVDVGGMSSRPGADIITWEEEWSRVKTGLEILYKSYSEVPISIDTIHEEVLVRSLDYGVSIVNDISGSDQSPGMVDIAAQNDMPYIVMHMQGLPSTMQDNPRYEDPVLDIIKYLSERVHRLRTRGVKDVIVDPGFGFGKKVVDNYTLLDKLHTLRLIECPILVGLSRKSMIYKVLDIDPDQALNGTTALHMKALEEGASILRVHDVKEAVQCVTLYNHLHNTRR